MRGLTISAHGGLDRIELRHDLPVPELTRDTDVRVRVRAAALNHLDVFVVHGLPGVTIRPPWILGTDGMGIVEAVGSAVTRVRVGDTVVLNPGISDGTCEYCLADDHPLCPRFGVLGEHRPGTLAEYVVVPEANCATIAPESDVAEAAGFTLAALTAWRMLVTRARLRAGEHVLIWGIGGGAALASLRIAKLLGARATVTSSSDEKLARARELGADDTINHARIADVGREMRARTGKRGVDVVVDTVGETTWAQSINSLARKGRIVTCGGTSGPMVTTDIRKVFWYQYSILGSTMGSQSEFAAVVEHFRAGRLRPAVDRVFPLEQGRAAFEHLEAGKQFGKVVVRID